MRAAVVRVANTDGSPRVLKRSVKHLYPIEVQSHQEKTCPTAEILEVVEDNKSKKNDINSAEISRPCQVAAVTGEVLRWLDQTEP